MDGGFSNLSCNDDCDDTNETKKEVIDTSNRSAVMQAITCGTCNEVIDDLLKEADSKGVHFTPDDIIELSYEMQDEDLLAQLVAHSKPRFSTKHAEWLDLRWGAVRFLCMEEAYERNHARYLKSLGIDW